MPLKVGIVGLPNVGKSTLFNALRSAQGKLVNGGTAVVGNYPFTTIEPNVGVVPVPDKRLDQLAEVVKESEGMSKLPPKVPATVEFIDIAGLIAGAHKGEGLGNKFLSHIREVDAICHVVRVFSDPDIIKEGAVDPKSDFEIVKTELDLADYEMIDRASAKASAGKEKQVVADLPLFSKKPILVVLNVDEAQLVQGDALIAKFIAETSVQGVALNNLNKDQVVVISAKVESELTQLSEDEQKAYLSDLGVVESGLERLAKKAFTTLGLITFLTAGEKEVRAWTIPSGTPAVRASATIHTDFEKKFIKAEVVKFEDFINPGGLASPKPGEGGWKKSREQGRARLEGKDYIVKDGDVIEFKIGN